MGNVKQNCLFINSARRSIFRRMLIHLAMIVIASMDHVDEKRLFVKYAESRSMRS